MPLGYYFGIQYEILFNNHIDLYNIVLPIFIELRNTFNYKIINIDKVDRLIIISNKNLEQRFRKSNSYYDYINNLFKLKTSYNIIDNIEEHNETYKYYDVFKYNNYIMDNIEIPTIISNELLNQYKNRLNYLNELYEDEEYIINYNEEKRLEMSNERNYLHNLINIQNIIINNNYYKNILEINYNLTDIELTLEEKFFINSICNHPKLVGLIKNKGFRLINFIE